MTEGSIIRQVILFSLPLMLGNVFQMLYNTVDSMVVGNFVSTQALAAVGSTSTIVNMLVLFFNGFSVGAGVVIGRYFGARDLRKLHEAVETTVASAFAICVLFTIIGVAGVKPMLRFMATPQDVFDDAVTYLTIYFGGISTLLIYNMGSGILRAVGDTVRPLFFLALTSVLNILLDLLFVPVFHMGIEGAAYATVLAQLISAVLTMRLLLCTEDIYRLTWKDMRIDRGILGQILSVGLPSGFQSVVTAFSNVFVQSYINVFGSGCMAGWSCYNKLDQFIMLPLQSMAMAATTFVSQNEGAGKHERTDRGTVTIVSLSVGVTATIAAVLFILAQPAVGLFTKDPDVVDFGRLFLRTNVFFLMCNSVNHTLAGALRGRGDAKGPMIILLSCFVGVRQLYLLLVTRLVANTPQLVGFGYPVGWMAACVVEVTYYVLRHRRPAIRKIKQVE